jgi:hypothetical protein
MLPLNETIRELKKVTIRYWDGVYQADDGHVTAGGHTPEGAVWNLLLARRSAPSKSVALDIRDAVTGVPIRTRRYDAGGQEIFDIPTAGQDCY